MRFVLTLGVTFGLAAGSQAKTPFEAHGPLRVAASKTHLEHADGTPFFVLADTCWTGPALSTEADWDVYLKDRAAKKFTAVQFNMVSPWRTAPTDAGGHTAYTIAGGKLTPNPAFYARLDARFREILAHGLLPVPVLCWAHKKGDAGVDLSEEQLTQLINFELDRYQASPALWILAGDNGYGKTDGDKWKRIGRAVFAGRPDLLVTTHPTGQNFPWNAWRDEKWLTVLGYQSGHGDSADTLRWMHSGPPAEYGKAQTFARPVLDLEPCYEAHNGYQSKKPITPAMVRRAVYWGLLVHPVAGVTYGGHGVWSWHTKPGKGPTDHESTGVAKVWRDALDLPGSGQMGIMRSVFESVPWTELRPAPELVQTQPGTVDPADFVAAAATPAGDAFVVYLPHMKRGLESLAAAVAGPAGDRVLTFVDPATGDKTTATLAQKRTELAAGPDGDLVVVYNGRKAAKP